MKSKNAIPFFLILCTLIFSGSTFQLPMMPEKTAGMSYKIAYNVLDDTVGVDNYEIYVMNPDATGKKNITNHKDVAWTYYAWKDKIYFISDRDTCYRCFFLYEIDAEGKNLKKVSDLQLEDSWMSSRKQGAEMIVSGRIGKNIRYQLFLLNTQNGKFTQLTNDTSAYYNDPVFVEDGKSIVFRYKKNKRNRTEKAELWQMDDKGNLKEQLTFYPEKDTTAKWYDYHAGPPKWNPKESFISYQSLQNGKYSLHGLDLKTKKSRKLFTHALNEGWHDWSPDGKFLALEMFDQQQKVVDIYTLNLKTNELKRLTDSWKYEQSPVWVLSKK